MSSFDELKREEERLLKGSNRRERRSNISSAAYMIGRATDRGTRALGKGMIGLIREFRNRTSPEGKTLIAERLPLTRGLYGIGEKLSPEMEVYQSIKNGSASISEISDRTGLDRNHVRDMVRLLVKKGIITKS